jgi:hypothetical protein
MITFISYSIQAQLFSYPNSITLSPVSNGNLGINMNDPQAKLHIYSEECRPIDGGVQSFPPSQIRLQYNQTQCGGIFQGNGSQQNARQRWWDINGDYQNFIISISDNGVGFTPMILINDAEAAVYTPIFSVSGGFRFNSNTNEMTLTDMNSSQTYFIASAAGIWFKGTSPDNQFKVDPTGRVEARNVKVHGGNIPEYVFNESYNLMPLTEIEKYVKENKHLPNIPSEKEYKDRQGIDLGELNLKLLEKVEELTLHAIQQQKEIEALKKAVSEIKK